MPEVKKLSIYPAYERRKQQRKTLPLLFNKLDLKDSGALKDIAPTLMHLLGLEQPEEMDGESLIAYL
jgi:bisphosphoglycerate-independent phosphoglycerate mutase (AlkP superfamily)